MPNLIHPSVYPVFATSPALRDTADDVSGSITDAATQIRVLVRTGSDDVSGSITDATTRAISVVRAATDDVSGSITDAAARVINVVRTTADDVSGSITDAAMQILNAVRTASDSAPADDAATRIMLVQVRAIGDDISGTLADQADRLVTFARGPPGDDISGLADVASGVATLLRLTGDSASASDDATRLATYAHDAADDISGLTDAAVQILTGLVGRPIADVTNTGWTTAPLWSKVDEETPDEADLITSPLSPSGQVAEMALKPVADPGLSTGHVVRYRARRQGDEAPTITVRLLQGGTQIASWTHALTTSWVTYEQPLLGAEADAITDYRDLRVEFSGTV